MQPRARAHARLIYVGVALASGGIAFYTPLVLAAVGQGYSGTWAALILFATNLGRVIGSHLGSRSIFWTERPGAIVSTILLEGVALFGMAFVQHPLGYASLALTAGVGSGLSFPGLKNYLFKLGSDEAARWFAGLTLAIRLGMTLGYVAGAWVGATHLPWVFTVIFGLFAGYALFMGLAMRAINREATGAAHAHAARAQSATATDAPEAPAGLSNASLMMATLVFWVLAIAPNVGFSLYIPRYVPGMSVSTAYWVWTVSFLLLQMPVTRRIAAQQRHEHAVLAGCGLLALCFALMALAPGHAALVVAAGVAQALAQIFFGPSMDVLVGRGAQRRRDDIGRAMARQLLYQNLGVMTGSLAAGAMFDLGVRLQAPALQWTLLALLALGLLAALAWKRRHALAQAAPNPAF